MFKIHKTSSGKGQTLQIISGCETTKANISLSNGGSLEQLVIGNEEIITNLSHLSYNHTYASSILFPFANRIKDGKYRYMDENYNLECNETAGNNALHGLVYDKSNDRVRTPKVNAIFGSIPILSKEISNIKIRRTNSCESILRFSDLGRIQTCNLLSRNQVHYSVMLRGPDRAANIT